MHLASLGKHNHVAIGIAFALAILATGCRQETTKDEHDDDHAGHVIPVHKPKNLPDAVRRLRELNGEIGLKLSKQAEPNDVHKLTLPIALDIANWLPEIAADSDLPEQPWNTVNQAAEVIVGVYQQITSNPALPDITGLRRVDEVVTELEKLVASADPKWFVSVQRRPPNP